MGGELNSILNGLISESKVGDMGLDEAAVGIRVGDWALEDKADVPARSSL